MHLHLVFLYPLFITFVCLFGDFISFVEREKFLAGGRFDPQKSGLGFWFGVVGG